MLMANPGHLTSAIKRPHGLERHLLIPLPHGSQDLHRLRPLAGASVQGLRSERAGRRERGRNGSGFANMHLIHSPLASWDGALSEVPLKVDRRRLARRLWRGAAADGTEFGVEVEVPLKHGDVVWASANARYVIRQDPEPVLEIRLDAEPGAAAVVGWAVGNLHFAIEVRADRLLAPDDPGLQQTLDRLGIRYAQKAEVFQPHRLAGSLAGHGQLRDRTGEFPHRHDHGHVQHR